MQVRIANKQDEADIRTFVESIYKQSGLMLDLESGDSDLRNIEANYFGKEGLFIVAEDEGQIAGIAGARRKSDSVLEFNRLIMSDQFARDQVVSELLDVVVNFANRLFYSRIDVVSSIKEYQQVFVSSGFKQQDQSGVLSLNVDFDY